MAEAFPPGWLRPRALVRVLIRLRRLPISAERKKYALHEWCVTVGVEMAAWMVAFVTGLPAGEV